MTSKTTDKFSPEVRTRAVRMALDPVGEHPSRRAGVRSIAAKIGGTPQTLHDWVKKAEIDSGQRTRVPTEMAEKLKALNGRTASSGRPTRSYGTQAPILRWRSSTPGPSHDRLLMIIVGAWGRADLQGPADAPPRPTAPFWPSGAIQPSGCKRTPTREFITSAIVNPHQDRPDLTDLARSPHAASFVRQEIRLVPCIRSARLIRLQRAPPRVWPNLCCSDGPTVDLHEADHRLSGARSGTVSRCG